MPAGAILGCLPIATTSVRTGEICLARATDSMQWLYSRLPWDVYLTTTINAMSGQFYTVTTGKDDNKDGAINDRPPRRSQE